MNYNYFARMLVGAIALMHFPFAQADSICNARSVVDKANATHVKYYKKGQAAERRSDYVAAFGAYHFQGYNTAKPGSQQAYYIDEGLRCADSELSYRQRLATEKVAARQARKARVAFRDGDSKGKNKPGANGSAFVWYQAGGYRGEAARKYVNFIKPQSEEKARKRFSDLVSFLRGRNNKSSWPRSDLGPHGQSYRQHVDTRDGKDDSLLKQLAVEMRQYANRQGKTAMQQEAKHFTKVIAKTRKLMEGRSPERQSLAALKRAEAWFGFYSDPHKQSVYQRAIKRGDTVMSQPNPGLPQFKAARNYYHLANAKDRLAQLKRRANQQAAKAESAGNLIEAQQFYRMADNKVKTRQLDKAKAAKVRKIEKQMHKTKKQQDSFNKGADDLEAELGL